MTKVRLKYLHCFNDRHGKPHCYFRYRGQQLPLPTPGTEGFATAYDALLTNIKVRHNVEFMPGSLAWAIEKFLASPLYNQRAETTRRETIAAFSITCGEDGDQVFSATCNLARQNDSKRNRQKVYHRRRHRNVSDFGVVGIRNRTTWIGARC